MSAFDEQKVQEISQSIAAIFDHADASLAEQCAAISLVLRVSLDNESDKFLRSFFVVNLIKHLTMDHKNSISDSRPAIELLRPNIHV